jgi:hypothetical protein
VHVFIILLLVALAPVVLISYLSRNKPGSRFGPIVCSRCKVELRGWNSSGQKQLWWRENSLGEKIYFCAKCKNK